MRAEFFRILDEGASLESFDEFYNKTRQIIWDGHGAIELKSDPNVTYAYAQLILLLLVTLCCFVVSWSLYAYTNKGNYMNWFHVVIGSVAMMFSFFENELSHVTTIVMAGIIFLGMIIHFLILTYGQASI